MCQSRKLYIIQGNEDTLDKEMFGLRRSSSDWLANLGEEQVISTPHLFMIGESEFSG